MKLLKLTLENFKGVRHAEYDFSDRQIVRGKNGLGKTTIADSYFFLFCGKSFAMVDNPNVRPNDAIDEMVTTVTADLDFDGKPVQVQKIQKFKRSKSGTTSLTNSYMVNSVPKSEKQFKEAMTELGVDFDKFLQASHPNVMLSGINNKKERDQLRNMLFQMASNITDLDVAKEDPELFGIAEMLKNYKAEEIAAMQNNTLRKIRENYGKEGEILRAKIEGLESAKVEIDADSIRKDLAELQTERDGADRTINAYLKKLDLIASVSARIMESKFKLQKLESDAVAGEIGRRSELDKDIMRLENLAIRLKDEIDRLNNAIANDRELAETNKNLFDENSKALLKVKEKVFDESTAICPTCGQKLPPDGVERARKQFDEMVKSQIQALETAISNTRITANAAIQRINDSRKAVKAKSEELKAMGNTLAEMRSLRLDMGNTPGPDMSGNEEYQKILSDIADDEDIVASGGVIQDEINTQKENIRHIDEQIRAKRIELVKADQNIRIDEQIEQARKDQINYEQQKANAEMILDQLKTLNMEKNTMLQESVNKNFNLIDFVLFTQQKNGEYKDACIPTINGKRFGESMNTALEIMAKIDAMNGIQKHFGFDYPIFLDDAEHLDTESMKKIESDHQLIMLCVSDDERLAFE